MSLSEPVREVFRKYPQWKSLVEQAASMPPFKLNYSPDVVELFDQYGLLTGMAWGGVYETQRAKGQQTEFVAWYLDGQLGLFYVGGEVVVNRLSLMSAAASVLLNRVEA